MKKLLFAGMALACVLAFVGCGKIAGGNRKQKTANCINNLKQIGTALVLYEDQYKRFPEKPGIDGMEELRMTELDEAKSYVCPASLLKPAEMGEPITRDHCSYLYFAGLSPSASPSLPIVMELPGNHDGVIHYLRIDASVGEIKCEKNLSVTQAVYRILGKESGFDKDEQLIVDQAKAWY